MASELKQKIQSALKRQSDSIPKEVRFDSGSVTASNVVNFADTCGLLSESEIRITNMSATELVGLIASRKLTAEECTRAYLKRAGIATQLLNCCTEIMADEAIARAKQLDDHLTQTGKTVGPLHGLPMSFKEHILMKDKVVHCSYVAWIDNIEPANGLIVDVLLECGVVPFCRTPQPQAVMHLETNSNIYGHTLNPHNRNCTPGGSSGGESSLLAFRGSPLGVGGDIGGSIRSPAAACGLYGFKPTCLRVPGGTKGLHKGRESILATLGPLGHSREDMELWMSSVLSTQPWLREPSILPLPWKPVPAEKKALRVAIMWTDGVVKPLPPITRALTEVSRRLRDAGISVVDWQAKDHDVSWEILSSLYYMNNAEDEYEMFEQGGESPLPLTQWLLGHVGVKTYSYDEGNTLLLRRNAFRTMYAQHWLDQEAKTGEIDIILCPVGPGPAPKLGTSKYWPYTGVWNLLDYPGAVFPVTQVLETDVAADYTTTNAVEKDIWDTYDPKEWLGMPICLQLVARRYQEEKLFADWKVIEDAIGRS